MKLLAAISRRLCLRYIAHHAFVWWKLVTVGVYIEAEPLTEEDREARRAPTMTILMRR